MLPDSLAPLYSMPRARPSLWTRHTRSLPACCVFLQQESNDRLVWITRSFLGWKENRQGHEKVKGYYIMVLIHLMVPLRSQPLGHDLKNTDDRCVFSRGTLGTERLARVKVCSGGLIWCIWRAEGRSAVGLGSVKEREMRSSYDNDGGS